MAELTLEKENQIKILAGLIGLAAVAAVLAYSVSTENIGLLTLLVAGIGFVVVFPFPRLAVVIVILFAQVQYMFTGYYGVLIHRPVFPVSFQWLDDIVLIALLVNLTLTKLLKGRDQPLEKAPALLPLALLFMVGVVSARLNGVPLVTGLIGQRYVFEMVVLYLAIVNLDFNERFLRGLVYLLLGIGVFQAAVGIFEFVNKYDLYAAGNHDVVQGTWGGGSANHLGVYFLCLAAMVLARLRHGWHGPKALLLGAFVILLVLTSSRTAILLMPLVFVLVLRERLKSPKYWIAAATALIFFTGCLAFYYRNTEAEVARDLGTDELAFQFNVRTQVIPSMAHVLNANSTFPLFGAGPGTYLTAAGAFFGSKMYMQVQSMWRTGQISRFISASYAVVWMEYGIAGLVLFGMALGSLFLFAREQERKVQSLFWSDYFRALQAIIVVYALAGGVFPLWTHFQTNVYLWLFPAIGVRHVILERRAAVQAAHLVSEKHGRTSPAAAGMDSPRNRRRDTGFKQGTSSSQRSHGPSVGLGG